MTVPGLDLAIVALVLLSAIIGLLRGLIREVFSLIVWAAALVLALFLAPSMSTGLAPLVPDAFHEYAGQLQYLGAFVCVFIAALVVGALVQWILGRLVDSAGLTGTKDRLLGLVFGSVRGALVCAVVLIAMRPFFEEADWWQASVIVPEVLDFEEEILALFDATREAARDLVGTSSNVKTT